MFIQTQPIFLSTCRGAEETTYFEWAVAWLAEPTLNSKHERAEDHSSQTPTNLRDQLVHTPTYNAPG